MISLHLRRRQLELMVFFYLGVFPFNAYSFSLPLFLFSLSIYSLSLSPSLLSPSPPLPHSDPAETSGCRAAKSHGFGWSASPPSRASQQLRRQRHNDQAILSDQAIERSSNTKRSSNSKRLGRNQASKVLSIKKTKKVKK